MKRIWLLLIFLIASSTSVSAQTYKVDSTENVWSRLVGSMAAGTAAPTTITVQTGDGAKFARIGVPLLIRFRPWGTPSSITDTAHTELDSVSSIVGDVLTISKRKLSNSYQLTWSAGARIEVPNASNIYVKQLQGLVGSAATLPDTTGNAGKFLRHYAGGGLDWATASAASGVTSFNARTGPVVPLAADYNFGQITGTVGVSQGGTGLNSIASGKMLYTSALNTLAPLSIGTGVSIGGGTISISLTPFSTTNLTEGTNLYYTDTRARAAITASSPLLYSSGNLSIPISTGIQDGYLSAADWTTFNNKQNALTLPLSLANGGTAGTTQASALKNLTPDTTGHTTNVLSVLAGGGIGWSSGGGGGSTGTVTSAAMTVPAILSVTGSPITSSGTFAVTLANETANTVFSGPSTGSPAVPTFRALVANDIPNLDAGKITTGTLPLARGGTNGTTQASALKNVTPDTTGNSGKLLGVVAGGGISWVNSPLTLVAGSGISIAAGTNVDTITNSGVTSITGTANQIIVTGSNAVTLSTPQNIAASSSPTFSNLSLGGTTGLQLTNATQPNMTLTDTKGLTVTDGTNTLVTVIDSGTTGSVKASGFIGNFTGNVVGNLTGNVTGNASGTSANVTGVVAIANGGSGASTQAGAIKNLTPDTTAQTGKILSVIPGGGIGWAPAGGSGTVTSVALTAPSIFTVGGSPVTASGTLALTYSGTALPIANGGTGQTTANTALNALLPTQTSNSGKVLGTDGTNTSWVTNGSGTVTSVAQTVPSWLTVAGSPITTSGTLAINAATGQVANSFLATPNGSTGALSVRTIVSADIPTLNQNTTGTSANVTGTVAIGNGGTGATTQAGAAKNILPDTTSQTGRYFNVIAGGGIGWSPAVTSFGGRVGAVSPLSGDYSAAMVTNAADKTNANLFVDQIQTFRMNGGGSTALSDVKVSNLTASNGSTTEQWSPTIEFNASAWKSNATAASQTQDWRIWNHPSTGTSSTSSKFEFESNNNGAGWTERASLTDAGLLTATSFAGSGASLTALNGSNISSGTVPLANGGTGATTQAGAAKNILPDTTAQTGKALSVVAGGGVGWVPLGGSGTVTSVGLTTPAWLSVGGSPVTASGTLAVTATTGQTANSFLATPNGSTGAVGLRTIAVADVPTLNQNTTGTSANVTGTVAVANGGTGATTLTAHGVVVGNGTGAVAITSAGTAGQVLTSNGASADPTWQAGGGGGLTNWTESVNTSAPNATVPVVRFLATNAATDVDIALSPKGAGAVTAQVADNTATGGNKRGTSAVDWQTVRSSNAQVAASAWSVVGGGANNKSTANGAAVLGGVGNTASGLEASVGGGTTNLASGDYSSAPGGNTLTATGYAQTVVGTNNTLNPASASGSFTAADPLFIVGNGNGSPSNALEVLGTGTVKEYANGIATTYTDGLSVNNSTLSTSGVAVQQSPSIVYKSHVWNTTATAADNSFGARTALIPTSGTTPSAKLAWAFSNNGAAYAEKMALGDVSGLQLNQDNIKTTFTGGLTLSNATAADVSNTVQMSPSLTFKGQAWKSNATAASQTLDWRITNVPVTGTSSTTSNLTFAINPNGGGYIDECSLSSSGTMSASGFSGAGNLLTNLNAGNIASGTLGVARGGTGAATLTAHGVVIGNGTSAVAITSAGTSGQILTSSGASADPSWTTTLPVTNGGTGVSTTATGDILYASGTNAITKLAIGTTGQILTVAGGVPSWASPFTVNVVTGTTQAVTANSIYIANNASQVVFTLPTTAAVGEIYRFVGLGAGGWKVSTNSSQTLHGDTDGTTGATGGVQSNSSRYAVVDIICAVANTDFVILNTRGAITIF